MEERAVLGKTKGLTGLDIDNKQLISNYVREYSGKEYKEAIDNAILYGLEPPKATTPLGTYCHILLSSLHHRK
jgi:hypothetical protein